MPVQALQLSAASAITQFDCSVHSLPIQVLLSKSGNKYDVSELTIETGIYAKIYDIPLTRTSPAMEKELNSAAISPMDSKAYATIFIKGAGYFLIRHDPVSVEFVAKLPAPRRFNKNADGYNTAAFSESGDYYLVTKGPKQHMIVINSIHTYTGYGSQSAKGLPNLKNSLSTGAVDLGSTGWIADMAVTPMDLDGSGQVVDYAFMLDKKSTMYIVKVAPDAKTMWKLKAAGDGLLSASQNGFGAAWNYQQRLFFASNFGGGVYEVDKKSINLSALTLTMKWVGKSEPTTNNDGMNCVKSEAPWPESGDCEEGFVEVDEVNGACPAGSTKK